MKRASKAEAFWAMQNAEVEKLIQDLPLLLANRQDEVDPSDWEKNGHAIRMRIERRLESMAAEGDGAFEWRRRGKGKGHRVFVFNHLGKERARLRGLEHEYFHDHHIRDIKIPPYPAQQESKSPDHYYVPEEACKHLLIFSVSVARAWGCYVWPQFFFELPKMLNPEGFEKLRLNNLKVEQIERAFDRLLLTGYMRPHGVLTVHGNRVPLLYPTILGLRKVDRWLANMKLDYPATPN